MNNNYLLESFENKIEHMEYNDRESYQNIDVLRLNVYTVLARKTNYPRYIANTVFCTLYEPTFNSTVAK